MSETLLRSAYSQHEAGNLTEAARLYGEVLKAEPHHFDATCMLGLLYTQRGEWAAAGNAADDALKISARSARGSYNLGCLLQGLNRHEEALNSYDSALAARPNYFEAFIHRGISLLALADFESALSSFDKAIALRPRETGAWLNRGNALTALRRHEKALRSYDQAVAIAPGFAPLHLKRGLALLALRRDHEALASLETALKLDPQNAETHFRRGDVLLALARDEDALTSFDAALALKPDYVDAMVSRGLAFRSRGNLLSAREAYDAALALKPDCVEALVNRGTVLFEASCHEAAVADYERALVLNPDLPYVIGSLAHYRMHCCEWQGLERVRQTITAGVKAGKPVMQPWIHLTFCESPEEQLQCARSWTARERSGAGPLWRGERYRHKKIRVAYLSADFHAHTTMFLMAGVFEQHDRSRFETMAISYGPEEDSPMRARLKRAFGRFLDVRGNSDVEIASQLRESEVDIAVDLKGYTQYGRTGILSCRPAPVQAQYLGYPGTMGTEDIDYILADRILIPDTDDAHYAEKVARLPDSYQANDSERRAADETPTRAALGLPEHAFVFASFNSVYKITPEAFALWLRILRQVEGSVLWLFADNPTAMRNLKRLTEAAGIAAERLIFAPRADHSRHLARLPLADLFLDTFPCNAHTTASDALWAGLPLLTLKGETFAGRVAASLLSAMGLGELIADSGQAYEAMAVRLAREPPLLAAIRTKLDRNRATTPLFDTKRFTRHLEAAYRRMWERAESGLEPESFTVVAETAGVRP